MKIEKNITLAHQEFSSLTDDSITASEDLNSLFVKTTMNQKYHDSIAHLPYIEENELSQYFEIIPKLIGITGTNGKTTTAAMMAHSLQKLGYKVALLGTRGFFINNERKRPKGLTTPTILELYSLIEEAKDCDYFVMEVSSHAIVQNRILGLKFSLKALSNITRDHLDFHKSIQEYQHTKNSFFDDSSLNIINADEPNAKVQNKLTYSLQNTADFYATDFQTSPKITATIRSANQEAFLNLNMCGKHNLYNALCCIASITSLTHHALQEVVESLADFEGVEGRMQIISHSPLIIVDFAHTDDGMEKILESFADKKIVVLFGAGGDRDRSKRPKMGEVAQKYAQKIYITSDNPRSEDPQAIIAEILQGITQEQKVKSINPIREQAIQRAIMELQEDEILFVLGKGDETYQIIGHQKIHFDDREVIADVLKSLEKRNSNDL